MEPETNITAIIHPPETSKKLGDKIGGMFSSIKPKGRIITTILGIFLLTGALGVGAYLVQQAQKTKTSAGGAILSFSTNNASPAVGSSFVVAVALDTAGTKVSAADVKVNFDSNLLTATAVTPGTFLPTVLPGGGIGGSSARIIMSALFDSSGAHPQTGTGVLGQITFRAKAAGNTNISFDSGSVVTIIGQNSNGVGSTIPVQIAVGGGATNPPTGGSATGGTITQSGGYTIHTFTSSGTFTPNFSGNVEVLVVAGGGGGGGTNVDSGGAGGGGAGGLIYKATSAVTPQGYSVVVGGGGAGGAGNGDGANGGNSSFNSLVAVGGGGGIRAILAGGIAPKSGGSGGGVSHFNASGATGGSGTAGQGNKGGDSANVLYNLAGTGGGGAGAAGGNVSASQNAAAGAGGAGLSYSISGAAVNYAGGGGGGNYPAGANGAQGGIGGGGAGGQGAPSNGANGAANTGGGGGGGSSSSARGSNGGNGGSGIVIIRYLTPTSDNSVNMRTSLSQLLESVWKAIVRLS